jgi:LppP/LprE lipoprotein
VLGTGALLGSGAAIAMMVMPSEEKPALPSAPASTDTPKATKKKKPRKPTLTRAQRRARSAAALVLTQQGYEPLDLADYDPRAELRVLIGVPGTDDDGDRRAFFFAGREFLGHDAASGSAKLRVVRTSKRTVTLGYRLYKPSDEREKPTGGNARVRFRWNGETVEPQGEIPPAAERAPPS